MKEETEWKLIFVFELLTSLFELKLLRPAFALLLALLLTMSVYFFRDSISAPNLTNLGNSEVITYIFKIVGGLILLLLLFYLRHQPPRKKKPSGNRYAYAKNRRRNAKRKSRDPHAHRYQRHRRRRAFLGYHHS